MWGSEHSSSTVMDTRQGLTVISYKIVECVWNLNRSLWGLGGGGQGSAALQSLSFCVVCFRDMVSDNEGGLRQGPCPSACPGVPFPWEKDIPRNQ